MLKTFDLRARERPLTVHGPRGLKELLVMALRVAGRVRFELNLVLFDLQRLSVRVAGLLLGDEAMPRHLLQDICLTFLGHHGDAISCARHVGARRIVFRR